ncbi:hypothetical protein GCM10023340_02320 [Nocardioides marinquilinus]|uniref:Esterase n=1 Tax=Nocardioides marinquilinus TaxID=1210400 RepID=A0ABP9PAC7_9ACTN
MPADLPPTAVEPDALTFRLADADHAHTSVRLWCDVDLGLGADPDLDLAEVPGGWQLRLPLPRLDCLEYLLEVDGELRLDPGCADRVDGAFGEHSWLALPGYEAPSWLDLEPVPGRRTPLRVTRTPVGTIEATVWAPEDDEGATLPLLVAHDGPEMDRFGELTRYVGAMVGAGRLPSMRVALLSPGARNERYAANPAYARSLVRHVVPRLTRSHPTRGRPVLSGQSLGAVAALHAATTSPSTFAGLLLQSGSFFTAELDPQESGFEHWDAVTGFVSELDRAPDCPVAMTCGTAEENHANNHRLAGVMSAAGGVVSWGEARQGHTWTCWRDLLDPHLTTLLADVW